MISEKERWGLVGKNSHKKWKQTSVLEAGWDLERQRNHSKQDSNLEEKDMDANEGRESGAMTGQPGRVKFHLPRGFQEWFLRV